MEFLSTLQDVVTLLAAGAHVIVDEEQEIGHRLGLEVMHCLQQHGHGLQKKR
jgi:hypothetical protein